MSTKTTQVPGTVTAKKVADGWIWKWRSPKGTDHIGPSRFPTEAKALTAGRKFARTASAQVRADAEEPDE